MSARHATLRLAIIAVFAALLAAVQARAADVQADPRRAALFWHQETGVQPRFDLIALTSETYARAAEIDRPGILQSQVARMEADVASIDITDDIYVLRIRSRLSEYDPREGGFFDSLFAGASYIPLPLEGNPFTEDNFAGRALDGNYELHFLNAPDFHFWPESEDKARAIMASAGREPSVVVEFRLQPIAAQPAPPVRDATRRIYGRVLSAQVEDDRGNPLFSRSVDPVAAADMPAARAAARDVMASPDDLTMAMLWHKIVDGPTPDWARLVSQDPVLGRADIFARDAVEQVLIAQAQDYYARIDPARAFRLTVNADVGPYDMATGVFPITMGGVVRYEHDFPFVAYPDDVERRSRSQQVIRAPERTTHFGLAFENGDALEGFPADQDTARAIGLNLRGMAEVVVRPVKAETVENRLGTDAEKFLLARIEAIRVTEGNSGKLLHEATYPRYVGPVEIALRTPAPETFEGVDPYDVEIRGLTLGMSEAEFTAAAQAVFGAAGPDSEDPARIRFRGGANERGYAVLDMDRNVKAISYVRSWEGSLAQPVYEATITKYGVPGRGSEVRTDPLTRSDQEALMHWTTNSQRVGGFTGRVWYWDYQEETTLYLDLEDRSKDTFAPPPAVISLD
ncbi:hypothetical protein ACVDG3_08530 [Meridianimarinicoccus sp. RP-17]